MANAVAEPHAALPKTLGILREGKKAVISYTLTLLDAAYIRSNDPQEVLSRQYPLGGPDHFVCPASKIKHGLREFIERIDRELGICPTCRAQHYCGKCPSCFITGTFGGVGDNKEDWSLQTRIDFTEAVAIAPGIEGVEIRTTNSVDPMTQKTNTSLTKQLGVPAGTEFYGTVTVWNPSDDVLKIVVGALMGVTRIGARTAVAGLCKVKVLGIRVKRVEPASLAPMSVILAGALPSFTEAEVQRIPFGSLEDEGCEEELVAAVQRYQDQVVIPTVAVLRGKVSKVGKDLKAVQDAITGYEAKTLAPGAAADVFEKGLKALTKAASGEEKEVFEDLLRQISAVKKKGGKGGTDEGEIAKVLDEVLVDLREALQQAAGV